MSILWVSGTGFYCCTAALTMAVYGEGYKLSFKEYSFKSVLGEPGFLTRQTLAGLDVGILFCKQRALLGRLHWMLNWKSD